ncbi:MAG: DUF6443 domain-containing protein [Bacteroidales bacterium]
MLIRYIITTFLFILLIEGGEIFSQTNIVLNQTITGNVIVSVPSPGTITLAAGFQTAPGASFYAYIGDTLGQNYSGGNLLLDPVAPVSGTTTQNYINTIIYREPKINNETGVFRHTQEIQYFDGLGRPSQSIKVGFSPSGNDIIQPFLYDNFGREAIKTLPYTGTRTGGFRTNVSEQTVNNYYSLSTPDNIEADNRAFTNFDFDNSPLNRIVKQTGPGQNWASNNKNISFNYLTNGAPVQGWNVTGDYAYSSFNYPINSLYIVETIDEQGNYSREYKDKLGQIVRKETKLGSEWLRTAYIYDDFGLLRCVVPPEANDPDSDTSLCYYYLYNDRNLMVEKKIPGGGCIKMVYDDRDRLRATQNSQQAAENEWSFIKYDQLNRPVVTGVVTVTGGTVAVKSLIQAGSMNESISFPGTYGYTSTSFPTTGGIVYTVTYYDNYNFISGMNLSDSLNSYRFDEGGYNFSSITDLTPTGKVTGRMTKVIKSSADNFNVPQAEAYTVNYFDKYGNLLRVITKDHMNGINVTSNIYEDITYDLIRTKEEYHRGNEHLKVEKRFTYDHTGRLIETKLKVNDQNEITLNILKYNETGMLITRYLHSDQIEGDRSFVQKVDYFYNIRGWLTKINDPGLGDDNDVFGMQLFYDKTEGLGGLALAEGMYNGNISGIKWGIKDEPVRGFQFTYDNLNRLMQTNYAEGSGLNQNQNYYTENISQYDKNGNIKALQRKYNNILVDNLVYTYANNNRSNQLLRVTDTGTSNSEVDDYPGSSVDYEYDSNGNMKHDGAKNIDIVYNRVLNLPVDLDFGSNNRIFFQYDATGAKVIKRVVKSGSPEEVIQYNGNIVYEGGQLSYILTEEGRLVADYTQSPRRIVYEYSLRDHLGNTRVVFMGKDLQGGVEIIQKASYYPFGLIMKKSDYGLPSYPQNRYLYNGKEINPEKMTSESLNLFDYGARFYDPELGRFTTQDRFAEKYYGLSPYQYAAGNPVLFVDVNGDSIWVKDTKGNSYYYGYTEQYGYGMYDKKGNLFVGKDKNLNAVNSALARLSLGKEGKALVDDLAGSSKNIDFNITSGKNQAVFAGRSWSIDFNPNSTALIPTQNGGQVSESFISLGHEMAHVQDALNNTYNSNTWQTITDPNTGISYNIPNCELYSTHVENKLRAENGLPLRTHYAADVSGNGISQTRLIQGNSSLYIQLNGTTNYQKVTNILLRYVYK